MLDDADHVGQRDVKIPAIFIDIIKFQYYRIFTLSNHLPVKVYTLDTEQSIAHRILPLDKSLRCPIEKLTASFNSSELEKFFNKTIETCTNKNGTDSEKILFRDDTGSILLVEYPSVAASTRTLLGEAYHRIKGSFQTLLTIIQLEARRSNQTQANSFKTILAYVHSAISWNEIIAEEMINNPSSDTFDVLRMLQNLFTYAKIASEEQLPGELLLTSRDCSTVLFTVSSLLRKSPSSISWSVSAQQKQNTYSLYFKADQPLKEELVGELSEQFSHIGPPRVCCTLDELNTTGVAVISIIRD